MADGAWVVVYHGCTKQEYAINEHQLAQIRKVLVAPQQPLMPPIIVPPKVPT